LDISAPRIQLNLQFHFWFLAVWIEEVLSQKIWRVNCVCAWITDTIVDCGNMMILMLLQWWCCCWNRYHSWDRCRIVKCDFVVHDGNICLVQIGDILFLDNTSRNPSTCWYMVSSVHNINDSIGAYHWTTGMYCSVI
jgi:hypothetical protein